MNSFMKTLSKKVTSEKMMYMFVLVPLVYCSLVSSAPTALWIFGDSLVDNGNNNFLNSIAKSNYFPYGIDFNRGPTGRFSNGKTFVDILGNLL